MLFLKNLMVLKLEETKVMVRNIHEEIGHFNEKKN